MDVQPIVKHAPWMVQEFIAPDELKAVMFARIFLYILSAEWGRGTPLPPQLKRAWDRKNEEATG